MGAMVPALVAPDVSSAQNLSLLVVFALYKEETTKEVIMAFFLIRYCYNVC